MSSCFNRIDSNYKITEANERDVNFYAIYLPFNRLLIKITLKISLQSHLSLR